MSRCVRATFVFAAFLMLLPASALAQQGKIAGTVRDAQGAVMPGVLVEVTSPALIEKVRSATRDDDRAVSNHQFAGWHLLGGLHARGLHQTAARERCPDDRIHRSRQCDDGRRPAWPIPSR